MEKKIDFMLNVFFMCHRLPERSFHYKGKPFPICARCTGMGIGYLIAFFLLIYLGILPIWVIILGLIPMAIDGGGQLFSKWTSTNQRRFVTGLVGGIAIMNLYLYVIHKSVLLGHYVIEKAFS